LGFQLIHKDGTKSGCHTNGQLCCASRQGEYKKKGKGNKKRTGCFITHHVLELQTLLAE